MQLSFITNNPDLAQLAEESGVERILIDLETHGKAERQAGRDLFISDHCISDIKTIKQRLHKSKLMVRIDSLNKNSAKQISEVIKYGADLIMLPYFHELEDAQEFIRLIGNKALPVLLVETCAAAEMIEDLTLIPGLSEIHIGLNDLSMSFGKDHAFELILDGTVSNLCDILRRSKLPFGFGGIGCLSRTDLPVPPELILAEQVCQGATRGWLGRTFREAESSSLGENIQSIREAVSYWSKANEESKTQMSNKLRFHIAKLTK